MTAASQAPRTLQDLLADVRAGKINTVVVYKVDRLTRSLADFAKLIELFDQHGGSFVSITQSFNTTSSMGRLTLNVLLSFAQFEREGIGERVRDRARDGASPRCFEYRRPAIWHSPRDSRRVNPAVLMERRSSNPRAGAGAENPSGRSRPQRGRWRGPEPRAVRPN
jgi:DNA invertase Pin-like site-specific DNA recombinase